MQLRGKPFWLALIFSAALAGDVVAQCNKNWIRKKCVPKVSPFIHNGQMTSSVLKEGENMTSTVTFYSGQDYRILICSEETLENVTFTVTDMSGQIVFDSKEHNNTDIWDFKVKTTMDLKIDVNAGKNESSDGKASGCVTILIGFKTK